MDDLRVTATLEIAGTTIDLSIIAPLRDNPLATLSDNPQEYAKTQGSVLVNALIATLATALSTVPVNV